MTPKAERSAPRGRIFPANWTHQAALWTGFRIKIRFLHDFPSFVRGFSGLPCSGVVLEKHKIFALSEDCIPLSDSLAASRQAGHIISAQPEPVSDIGGFWFINF